jgi:hypothetical protein
VILRVFPDEWRPKIAFQNAYEWFDLERRLGREAAAQAAAAD